MNIKKELKNYINSHPDYWEFEDELKEVLRLKKINKSKHKVMKIITKEIEQAFAKQGYTGNKSAKDIKIIMKLFNPTGAGTWYLYEKEDEDIYWGFVTLGDPVCAECGTVSMQELMEYKGRFGLGIERDMHFEPFSKTLEEVQEIIKSGGHV